MSMFDLTTVRAFKSGAVEPDEEAVSALLHPHSLPYLRDLRRTIDQDPIFLVFHEKSVSLRVQNLLSRQGISYSDDSFENQVLDVVMEAVSRLRNLER